MANGPKRLKPASTQPEGGQRIVTEPLISAVLPTYNRSGSLFAAVQSVLDQEYQNVELIVVDDASDPEFRPCEADFADSRVRLLVREANGGVAAAQNTGLGAVRGEFVAFIHSDDLWLPNKLRAQSDLLRHDQSAAAAEGATNRLGNEASQVVAARLAGATFEDLFHRRIRNLHIAGLTFRTEALRSVGGFDETLRSYEDFDLLVRLLRGGAIVCSGEIVATVDQRGSDRLASSPWMSRGRARLLEKYGPDLIASGRLPDGWRDWAIQVAIRALADGEPKVARRNLALAGRGRSVQALKTSPLYAASFAGRRVAMSAGVFALRRLDRSTAK